MNMKKSIATLVACAATLLISVPAQAQKNSLVVTNNSYWTISQFFLSSVDSDNWGQDLLGYGVIGTGETFTLRGIRCGTYDVKLVDEDSDECEIRNVDICSGRDSWAITNDYLLNCEADTQRW